MRVLSLDIRYGDRTPKSPPARLFGILWILTGLILCSFFTATFTSALTSSSMLHRKSLLGVKVSTIISLRTRKCKTPLG